MYKLINSKTKKANVWSKIAYHYYKKMIELLESKHNIEPMFVVLQPIWLYIVAKIFIVKESKNKYIFIKYIAKTFMLFIIIDVNTI